MAFPACWHGEKRESETREGYAGSPGCQEIERGREDEVRRLVEGSVLGLHECVQVGSPCGLVWREDETNGS